MQELVEFFYFFLRQIYWKDMEELSDKWLQVILDDAEYTVG